MSQKHNLANKESYGDINVIAIHSHYQVSSLQNGKIVKWRYAFIVPMTFSSSHFLYLPMIVSEIVIFNTVSANLGYIISRISHTSLWKWQLGLETRIMPF